MYMQQGSRFNNYGNSTFASTASAQISGSTSNLFNNYGTLNSNCSATFTISVSMSNIGKLNVLSNTLSLNGGGDSTGSFSVSSGATLSIGYSSVVYIIELVGTVSGSGTLDITGGVNYILGTITVAKFRVDQGSATIGSQFAASSSVVISSSGTLIINTTVTILPTVTFQWNGGTIYGPAILELPVGTTLSVSGNPTLGGSYYDPVLEQEVSVTATMNARGTSTFTM
jgi:hypothetical protein